MKWAPFLLLFLPTCASVQRLRASARGVDSANATTSSSFDEEVELEQSSRELQQPTLEDVCIVGAGFAGLGSAKTLHEAGKKILVLEAQDYFGGRARTVRLDGGLSVKTIELGANWIVSASQSSALYDVALASGIPINAVPYGFDELYGVWTDLTGVFGLPQVGGPYEVPIGIIGPLQEDLFRRFLTFQRPLQSSSRPDQSLASVFNKFIAEQSLSNDEILALNYTLDAEIANEYAADLSNLSVKSWETYGPINKGYAMLQQEVNPQGGIQGYTGVVNFYATSFQDKIKLNHIVTKIDWSSSFVKVSYTTQYGMPATEVSCRHAIVTVPLGVLKRNTIEFVPRLPATKTSAITKLGMGFLNKAILHFEEGVILPWNKPDGISWVEKIARRGEQGNWTLFLDLRLYTDTNVLVAWTTGTFAERVEKLTDEEIKAEVMTSLMSMFGATVPPPKEWIITRWGENQFARGSYSYHPVGSTPQDRVKLRASLKNILHFAGEATSTRYYGTTRGALEEGFEAAKKVAKLLKRI
jgi:monoamine oxidase